jgi:hypothetical protein
MFTSMILTAARHSLLESQADSRVQAPWNRFRGYSALSPDFSGQFLRSIEPGNPAASSTLTLSGLGSNIPVTVLLSLAIIDSWDGSSFPPAPTQSPDFFNVRINGSTVFSETFTNLSVHGATQTYAGAALAHEVQLGFEQSSSRLDSAYLLSVTGLSDNSGAVTIDFYASGSGWHAASAAGPEEESWAIDNVRINVVPEPAAACLLAAGIAFLVLGCVRQRFSLV